MHLLSVYFPIDYYGHHFILTLRLVRLRKVFVKRSPSLPCLLDYWRKTIGLVVLNQRGLCHALVFQWWMVLGCKVVLCRPKLWGVVRILWYRLKVLICNRDGLIKFWGEIGWPVESLKPRIYISFYGRGRKPLLNMLLLSFDGVHVLLSSHYSLHGILVTKQLIKLLRLLRYHRILVSLKCWLMMIPLSHLCQIRWELRQSDLERFVYIF